MNRKYDSLFLRLVANSAEPETDTGCWLWTGQQDRKGYGRVTLRVNGKPQAMSAHREMARCLIPHDEVYFDDADPFGPIFVKPPKPLDPDLHTIDHLCWIPLCVNPDHHEHVTRSENTTRKHNR